MAQRILIGAGLTDQAVESALVLLVGRGSPEKAPCQGLTPACRRCIGRAAMEALGRGRPGVEPEHLLLGVLGEGDCMAARVLSGLGMDGPTLYRQAVASLGEGGTSMPFRPRGRESEPSRESRLMEQFSQDLTRRAAAGELDPVTGRDTELERITEILCRRTKNNPVLLGEPGVGKTALAEALAQRIAAGAVPTPLKNVRLLSLDLSSVVAGTKYRGEFEERLRKILKEIKKLGDVVLFLDELHTLVGAGSAEGAIDAANILKPALGRGEIQIIGATTREEYRRYICKDPALERRFQPVQVDEPDVEDTISILRGLKEKYEIFHGVQIHDNALVAAATLSNRYITDRFLPDKAIDLVDEACALIRTEIDSMPAELDDVRRRIMQMEIEEMALSKETDTLSRERLEKLKAELAEARENFNGMKAAWEADKQEIDAVKNIKTQIDQTQSDIEAAQRNYEYEKAAKLRYSVLPALEQKLEEAQKKSEERAEKPSSSLVRDTVTKEEIAGIVAKWTGIPVAKLVEGEREKILHLDEILHQRVIGQNEAVTKVSEAILRSRAGIGDPNRPIGSFLFLGPTGVGKTELAKALAESLFDDEHNLIRIDMSEYMEKFSVSRLIGAPPGYVGYDEGGQLTEAVRRKPYSVILFDEIEKAHPDVFNILLQVLDDGRITDSQGRTVDFKNTVIILTSNLGSQLLLEGIDADGEISQQAKDGVSSLLKNSFRPEFLNRLDEIVFYKPLRKEDMGQIIDIMLRHLQERLADRSLKLHITQRAKEYIIEHGFDPVYGARPLKRYIQSHVETMIARTILSKELNINATITVDADEAGGLQVTV